MFWLWLILGVLFFIVFFLLFIKVSVNIHGVYSEQLKSCTLSVGIFSMKVKKNFTLYPSSHVEKDEEEEKETDKEQKSMDINYFIKNFHELHTMSKKLLKRISMEAFSWHTSFGLGEAMQTGIAAGALWTLKGSIVGLFSTCVTLKEKVDIDVRPVFQGKGVYTEINSTLSFRFLFILLSGISVYFDWRKMEKRNKEIIGSQKMKKEASYSNEPSH